MRRKPIRIDWEALETAFEGHGEDPPCYLDLVTGHVLLDGQGERDDPEADGPRRSDALRLHVDPPGRDDEIAWVREFLGRDGAVEEGLRARLLGTLGGEDPLGAFRRALREEPETRDRWFAFKSDRVHASIEAWLARHGVSTADSPPWA